MRTIWRNILGALVVLLLMGALAAWAAPAIYDQLWAEDVENRVEALEVEVFGTTTTTVVATTMTSVATTVTTSQPTTTQAPTTTVPTTTTQPPSTTSTTQAPTTTVAPTTTQPPTSTTTTGVTTTTQPVVEHISIIGCSNTRQAVEGYLALSSKDQIVNTAQNGAAVWDWDRTWPWSHYDQLRAQVGHFDKAILDLCARASQGIPTASVDDILRKIWARDPGIPVYIKPLNFWTDDECPITNGNYIPNLGAQIADQYAASNPLIFRGPDLGPLNNAQTASDDCHLTAAGQALVGSQLVAFFD